VEQVVATQVEAVDEGQRHELVVQLQDLPPVGGGRGRRVAVDGVDRRLELVRAGLVAPQALPDDPLAFGDAAAVPAAAVLVGVLRISPQKSPAWSLRSSTGSCWSWDRTSRQ
jgi:hypothetical protein